MSKCRREACDEQLDKDSFQGYCTNLCREVDKENLMKAYDPTDRLVGALRAAKPVDTSLLPPPYHSSRPPAENTVPVLPTDPEERKEIPIFSGVLNYFPLAIAAIARHSKRGNDKHNPGEPLHWSRGKSTDQENCIARHLIDIDTINKDGEYEEAVALAWRALAALQTREEKRLGKPMSRGSR